MITSDQIDQLTTALAQAQLIMPNVPKNGYNPHFKNKYATLDDVVGTIRAPLAKHGLCLVQGASMLENRVLITSRLIHKSGQWIETNISLRPDKDTPQAMGSALSYGKRYQAISMLALETGEDDDGEAASSKSTIEELMDRNNSEHQRAVFSYIANNFPNLDAQKILDACHGKPYNRTTLDSAINSMEK